MATELDSVNAHIAALQEREAAMREILQVISASRDDEDPVFDTILSNACRLCDAPLAGLVLVNDERTKYELRATRGAKPELVEELQKNPPDLDPKRYAAARAIIEKRVVHVEDLSSPDLYGAGDSHRLAANQIEGIRTVLFVPLIWDQISIGAIGVWRREVKPFSEDEISLVETFTAQAVIAIENIRQFREVQTRLERETGMAEVLSLISTSREDEAPVFEMILSQAAKLCNAHAAALALGQVGDSHQTMPASYGLDPATVKVYDDGLVSMDPELSVGAQAIVTCETVHIRDMAETEAYKRGVSVFVSVVEETGIRTNLLVPLRSKQGAIGVLILFRKVVQPYTLDEITLVESFAAQAVIAIENVRQFREVQTRLERETASADVLDIVSRSRDDDQPVFEKISQAVARLCDASLAYVSVLNAARTHVSIPAQFGARPEFAERLARFNVPVEEDWIMAVDAALNCRVISIEDLSQDALYKEGNEYRVSMVDEEGIRSVLVVPLVKGAQGMGCIFLYRREVRPFTEDEVAVVRNFAAQAVIAIENVRQFKALETLNAELGSRVEAQVGEIERMGKLKRFLPAAVADTVVMSGSEDMLKSHRALLGALFCDIRGFTAFCETAEPEETIEVLQTYHQEMGKLINAHGAGVDHRMGDGIMVLFNDPIPCDDPAGDAVRLAVAMRARMSELSKDWKRLGFRLGFGVGVSLGYATVGMVGYEGRFDYTASGTAINLASRLCDMAEDGEVLLSTRAAIAVEDDFVSVSTGEVTLKGIREPVEVFRLVDSPEE